MLKSSPRSGPASQPGQPPLRAGTSTEGLAAVPAASRKALATTATRPAFPTARAGQPGRTRITARTPARRSLPGAVGAPRRARRDPVAACIGPFLPLLPPPVCLRS